MSKYYFYFLSLFVFLTPPPSHAEVREYKPFLEPYAKAIVRVLIRDVGICTGFVVAKQKVVTARHCLTSQTRTNDVIIIYDSHTLPPTPVFATVSRFATMNMPKKINDVAGKDKKLSEDFLAGNDFILLHTEPLDIEPLKVIKQNQYKQILGAAVTIAGYPYDSYNLQAGDIFPDLVYHPQDCKVINFKGYSPLPTTNCYTVGGNSGGPIIVYLDGQPVVVGIVSGGTDSVANPQSTFFPVTDEFIQRFR